MKRSALTVDPGKVRDWQDRSRQRSTSRSRPVSPASPEQRRKIAEQSCVVCGASSCDPAHLIPRSLWPDKDGDPRRVIPLCRQHHQAYDRGALDLLPYESVIGEELCFAVFGFGLLRTLTRVSNSRWSANQERAA